MDDHSAILRHPSAPSAQLLTSVVCQGRHWKGSSLVLWDRLSSLYNHAILNLQIQKFMSIIMANRRAHGAHTCCYQLEVVMESGGHATSSSSPDCTSGKETPS